MESEFNENELVDMGEIYNELNSSFTCYVSQSLVYVQGL